MGLLQKFQGIIQIWGNKKIQIPAKSKIKIFLLESTWVKNGWEPLF